MPIESRLQMLLQIARLYYEKGETQQEIATKLNISRPQVSRYLQQAREMGVVQINIVDPREVCEALGQELKERFGL
ncbi:MAG: helix-turn-helix domain-containing protein, partial [bacterium]